MILKLSLCERQNMLREGIPTKIYTYKIKGSRAKQYLFKTIRSLLQKGYGGKMTALDCALHIIITHTRNMHCSK